MSKSAPLLLLIEDDDVYRESVHRLLDDFRILDAATGKEALEAIGAQRIDCVLLDYRLPDCDGLKLLPEFSAAQLPVIMMTAEGNEKIAVEAMKQGCQDYLVKTDLTRDMLCSAISDVIERATHHQIPGYQLLERIGSGSEATVYKARQLSLDRIVAIKILPKKLAQNPQFVKRLHSEGRAVAKLSHPNIVGALDVGQAGEHHYFVMEYIEGQTARQKIESNGKHSEEETLAIGIQIAHALYHAHEAGFIHRDVKPGNIMMTKEGVAKLTDLGLARAVSDRDAAEAEKGKMYGTPFYISPEQIRGVADVDFRADIYGLGGTLYHIVTGQVPYDGPNPKAVMEKHLRAALIPPDHINPRLSQGIAEIIELSMAKNRDDRYATCKDLLEDLEAVANGEPPMQARKVLDLSALATLKRQEDKVAEAPVIPAITGTPLFWFAIAGWVLFALMVFIFIVRALMGDNGV